MRELKGQMHSLMQEQQNQEVIDKMKVIDECMDELEAREELFWAKEV